MKNLFNKKNYFLFLFVALTTYSILPLSAQFVKEKGFVNGNEINPDLQHSSDKKLIQATNSLQWSFVKDNISRMESKHPEIDGIALSMNGNFMSDYLILHGDKLWTDEDAQINAVSQVKWGKFTENFVILVMTDSVNLEFFNDSKWSVIISNAKMISKMVNAGHLKGVILDDENYFERKGKFPWKYNDSLYPGSTFEQVLAKSRQRGKEFMQALQSNVNYPIVIFNMFWFGDYWNNYDSKTSRQVLYMPFMDGMLEAAHTGDLFIDANECAYYYQSTTMFTDIYNEYRMNRFPKYGAADLQDKYKTQVQIGHGIYPSLYYGLFRWPFTYADEEHDPWWKHQLYNSLLTSDKYVWIWSERWDWWGDGKLPLTPNFASIISEVKSKLNNQQSLNYDLVQNEIWKGDLTKPSEKWHLSTSPTVTITSPANKSKTKSKITIRTSVSDNARKVEFYINSMRVGVDSIAPYSVKVSGLARGMYTIFARVFDIKKEHTTSAPIILRVRGKGVNYSEERSNNATVNVGYDNVKKKDMTTTVNQIDGQNNKYASYQNIYDMIRGEVPGVQVNGKTITIRGQASINLSTEPLLVVEGMAVNSIDDISPQAVKSIEILKGSSASIYGSRGSNGVILIYLKGATEKKK